MRRWIGLGLLATLGALLTACIRLTAPPPASILLLYYPQSPSLCPGGVKMFNTDGYPEAAFPPVTLQPTTSPPTPPAPGEVIPRSVPIEPLQATPSIPRAGGPEQFHFAFACETGSQRLTTPGPNLLPRDDYVRDKGWKSLVIVEDPSQAGYLRWYWIYIQ